MQTAPHLQSSQNSCVALAEEAFGPSTSHFHSSIMRSTANNAGSRPPLSSNNTTPTSTRRSSLSSLNHPNISSASSDVSTGIPQRSSMKSNLKPSKSVGALNRRSAPPTVRFLDPEPMPKRDTEPRKRISLRSPACDTRPVRPGNFRAMSAPNLGSHQYQPKKIMAATLTRPPLLSPASRRASVASSPGNTAGPPRTSSRTQTHYGHPQAPSGPMSQVRQRFDRRFSAPVVTSQVDPRLDPRWSGIPLPAGFVPTSRTATPTQRAMSYQSVVSNLSSSSTPSAVTKASSLPSKQYDPLENYIPCMAALCTAHYTPAHSGPTYYVAQEPYNLSRHHGYCPRHASKEMKEANALCRKEYETMRQNAGRKTLGAVAQDFEIFLQLYREARQVEDAQLQKAQSNKILGSQQTTASEGQRSHDDEGFDWRYTPRNCTTRNCTSLPYSPFSTDLYSFYNTPHSSTQLMPLTTLCASCSKAEAERFGAKIMEKWNSRCGWDGKEWDTWYTNAKRDREMELEYWEKAQEKAVRGRMVSKASKCVAEKAEKAEKPEEGVQNTNTPEAVPKKEKRRSLFRRMFRRHTASASVAPVVAV